MPASVTNKVASSTRKRLRADQSMILASMSVSLVLLRCLQPGDNPYARLALDDLEADGAARLDAGNQRRVRQREIHGHAGPAERLDRPVGDADRAVAVDRIQPALRHMAHRLLRCRS